MTHVCKPGRHGGLGAAAARNGETLALCGECGNRPLRDADRVLAHSYAAELYPPRPPIEPVVGGWREVREIVAGIVVMLLICAAFWTWMAIAAAAQVPA